MNYSRQAKIDMGVIMYRHGALEPDRHDEAVSATSQTTGLSEDIVRQHWSEVEQFITVMAARGVLLPDPSSEAG